jgi:RNA polymerase sigma factor (sigma-70 family)
VASLPPFQRVLDEHRDVLWRTCVALVGRSDADDVFQETCMAALRAYPKLRPSRDHNLRAWLLTIAHRKGLDHLRAAKRRALPVEDVPEVAVTDPAPPDDELWARVRALPPRQRAVVTLRYAGDLTYAEIALALDTTEAAARRAGADGVQRLREQEEVAA